MADAQAVVHWFQQERGIEPETLAWFGVGIQPDGGVVIPYRLGYKTRKGIPHGDRKFFFDGEVTLFNDSDIAPGCQLILTEGETDAMRLWQELQRAGRTEYAVAGLPGIDTWNIPGTDEVRPVHMEALRRAAKVHIVFDNDKDYAVQGRVDTAWRSIRRSLGRGVAARVRLPSDVKDVCEFFSRYDLNTFLSLLNRPGGSESRFKALDLTREPPPVRWLVEGMLCRGDVHLLLGEPGIGKSWITMDLAVATVMGRPWLNRPIVESGRVLYLDEENAQDLVFHRLRQLGLTAEAATNIRYLSNLGLRLDRDPEDFIDEAIEYDPHLIVLDSLTRIHGGDEDKAGVMAALYNDALKPLARETGAAVVVLHHANKSDTNSSYRRSRGSGEIIANADFGYDLRVSGINALTMAKFKSRRGQSGEVLHIAITDTQEGGVRVIGGAAAGAPF